MVESLQESTRVTPFHRPSLVERSEYARNKSNYGNETHDGRLLEVGNLDIVFSNDDEVCCLKYFVKKAIRLDVSGPVLSESRKAQHNGLVIDL